ncbi:MAG TPA: lysozyme inhibitor LprI family protein [Stellaceae bacterium]|nr:lysozyme inhibitor LprI family protein [Stellaceae bacterium]
MDRSRTLVALLVALLVPALPPWNVNAWSAAPAEQNPQSAAEASCEPTKACIAANPEGSPEHRYDACLKARAVAADQALARVWDQIQADFDDQNDDLASSPVPGAAPDAISRRLPDLRRAQSEWKSFSAVDCDAEADAKILDERRDRAVLRCTCVNTNLRTLRLRRLIQDRTPLAAPADSATQP